MNESLIYSVRALDEFLLLLNVVSHFVCGSVASYGHAYSEAGEGNKVDSGDGIVGSVGGSMRSLDGGVGAAPALSQNPQGR